MYKRIIFDVALLASIFFIPWWGVAILGFFGAFLFSSFYEIVIAGAIFDLLYGARSLTLYGFLGTFSAVCIFFLALYAKRSVR